MLSNNNKKKSTCPLKTTKHWWKKLKKTYINGKTSCVHGLEDGNTSHIDFQVQCNPYQNPSRSFFGEIDKRILKFIWKCKGFIIVNTILKKRKKVGRLTLPNFET